MSIILFSRRPTALRAARSRKSLRYWPIALGALLLSAAVFPARVQAAAPDGCELHVWPANDLRSTFHGWLHGGLVDGAVNGRDGYRKLPPSPLPTMRQADVLRTIPLAERLALAGYRVAVHDSALTSDAARRTAGRLQNDTPACYAELVVDDVFFQEDVANGRFLKVLYRYRSFTGEIPQRAFGTYIQTKLLLFPAKDEANAQAALDELASAYDRSLTAFGTALNRPEKKKRR